ncbi:MAG: peptidoglycan DD-metalloendopeptidase family protein [Pseudomonadota bacterium]
MNLLKHPTRPLTKKQVDPSALLGFFVPSYSGKHVAIVDLDQEARDYLTLGAYRDINPRFFADATFCSQFVNELHKSRGIDASLGGYLEDRAFLWQGTYLAGGDRALHLGVDFNVPAGSKVATPFDGVVILIDNDTPDRFGWGPRIFLECHEAESSKETVRYVYIFAHLAGIQVTEGTRTTAGQIIAAVGAPPDNGDWFPHLHVQKVRGEVFDRYRASDLMALDGYGLRSEVHELEREFPNPVSRLVEQS